MEFGTGASQQRENAATHQTRGCCAPPKESDATELVPHSLGKCFERERFREECGAVTGPATEGVVGIAGDIQDLQAGMPTLEVLRMLYDLLNQRVIEFRSRTRTGR